MLSVLMLTRNRRALLERCLGSLASQRAVRGTWEIVVIDTGSDDGTTEFLAEWARDWGGAGPARRWRSALAGQESAEDSAAQAGLAFARARTLALESAAGDRLLFTDDDCLLPLDWVARGAAALDAWDAVGGLVLAANRLPLGPRWTPEAAWLLGLSVPGHFRWELAGSHHLGQTACLGVRRDALPPVPFPSILADFGAGGGIYQNEREDSALWRRLRWDGRRVAFDPAWIAFHHTAPERGRFPTLMRRAWRDGRAEADQRFNVGAAQQAAEAIGENLWGAAGLLVLPPRRPIAPLTWAVRELSHALRYARRAPAKFARRLVVPLARGAVMGALHQVTAGAGIAACAAARRLRSTRALAASPRRVVIAAHGYLGDMVLLEPVMRALKSQPDPPELLLLTSTRFGRSLYANCPFVDAIVPVSRRTAITSLRRTLAREQPDLALVPYWQDVSPRLLFDTLGDCPTLGFDHDCGFAHRRHFERLTWRLPKDLRLHEVDNLARLFQWAGLRGAPLPFDFSYLTDGPDVARAPRDAIVLHWGSERVSKTWSEERWAEVALTLRERTRRPLAVTGAPSDAGHIDELLRFFGVPAVNLARLTCNEPAHAIPLLRRCALMITTCSGPKHLAFAAGIPTVSLYGDSDPARWGPYGGDTERHASLVGTTVGLTPSELAGQPPNAAMLRIGVREVVDAAMRLLEGAPAPSREPLNLLAAR